MVKIERLHNGRIVGKGRLAREEVKRLFDFCKTFDFSNIRDSDPDFLFDVRSGVVHWLDKKTKAICSSLYFDINKGNFRIELGDLKEWTDDLALQGWIKVINIALGGTF